MLIITPVDLLQPDSLVHGMLVEEHEKLLLLLFQDGGNELPVNLAQHSQLSKHVSLVKVHGAAPGIR